ncbi:MAG: hypothetical protein IT320_27585 [Anaerolineae bacterium]|nr:hypothetical protein [Anaerolineae bacterium]
MSAEQHEAISAQVILKSASGEALSDAEITSETLARYQASPEMVRHARTVFDKAGFDVGHYVGISFDITAPPSTFRALFGLKVQVTDEGGYAFALPDGRTVTELPARYLPDSLVSVVETVAFPPPPDFGPPSY